MQFETLHHVSLVVRDLEESRRFYRDVLGLAETARPPFNFAGAWFQVGSAQQLHLILSTNGTFRASRDIDTRDTHFALRVQDYSAALEWLHAQGFREDAPPGDPRQMRVNKHAVAGFPQIYILDPDCHVIEINAAQL